MRARDHSQVVCFTLMARFIQFEAAAVRVFRQVASRRKNFAAGPAAVLARQLTTGDAIIAIYAPRLRSARISFPRRSCAPLARRASRSPFRLLPKGTLGRLARIVSPVRFRCLEARLGPGSGRFRIVHHSPVSRSFCSVSACTPPTINGAACRRASRCDLRGGDPARSRRRCADANERHFTRPPPSRPAGPTGRGRASA